MFTTSKAIPLQGGSRLNVSHNQNVSTSQRRQKQPESKSCFSCSSAITPSELLANIDCKIHEFHKTCMDDPAANNALSKACPVKDCDGGESKPSPKLANKREMPDGFKAGESSKTPAGILGSSAMHRSIIENKKNAASHSKQASGAERRQVFEAPAVLQNIPEDNAIAKFDERNIFTTPSHMILAMSSAPSLSKVRIPLNQLAHKFDQIYGNKKALTCDGVFDGVLLDRRLMAKAYSTTMLTRLAVLGARLKGSAEAQGKTGFDLDASVIGRLTDDPSCEIIASQQGTSRLQSAVLTMGGTPFLAMDLGNNAKLAILNSAKGFNLGYYNEGNVNERNLSFVSLIPTGKATRQNFYLASHSTESIQAAAQSEGQPGQLADMKVLKLQHSETEPDDAALKFGQKLLNKVLTDDVTSSSSLAYDWLNNLNAYRQACDLPPEQEINNNLLQFLQRMHQTTTNSIQSSAKVFSDQVPGVTGQFGKLEV